MALIQYITQIQFEFGAVKLLRGECERVGIHRPLIVTDKGVKEAGIVDRVLEVLSGGDRAPVYDGTPPNPNEAAVRQAVSLYVESGCDGIIAVGGGSSIDLAKGVAVCATHEGPLRHFAFIEGGAIRISSATAPVIAIPTTAGTGSEVGRGAILILDDGRKVGVISSFVVPKVAICDPELTMKLPAALTAATGMDAIAHCIETFMSPLFNPPADGIALDGLRRAWRYIEKATQCPNDKEARLNMMSASMQGALAFQKGLGCVHSLSHSLGAYNPTLHHGTLNAIFLPAVIEFNQEAPSVLQEEKMSRLAHAMGVAHAREVAKSIHEMTHRLELPESLSALGVAREAYPSIVQGALDDHSHKTNPRNASADDYHAILEASF